MLRERREKPQKLDIVILEQLVPKDHLLRRIDGGSNPLAARALPDIFRKGILRQLSFSLRTQARKVKLLSALVFFTPPRSIWCIPEFCQIV